MLIRKMAILLLLGLSSISANSSDLMSGLTDIVDKAEDKKAEDKKILNNAFKQRMKTQKMARDAVLIYMDFNTSFYQKDLLMNANEFNSKFEDLINDKKDIDKVVVKLPEFKNKIEDFKTTWSKFYENIKILAKDSKNKKALDYLLNNNLTLLSDIDYIFSNFLKFYQSTDKLEASMAHIKIMLFTQVGKPRMYITKIVKERLLVKENINKKDNQKKLKNSIENMDKLMKALKDGNKDLELDGTEDKDILDKLAISQKIWEEVKSLVNKKKLTKEDLTTLVLKNDKFIEAHTEVVKLVRSSNDN